MLEHITRCSRCGFLGLMRSGTRPCPPLTTKCFALPSGVVTVPGYMISSVGREFSTASPVSRAISRDTLRLDSVRGVVALHSVLQIGSDHDANRCSQSKHEPSQIGTSRSRDIRYSEFLNHRHKLYHLPELQVFALLVRRCVTRALVPSANA